MVRTFVVALLLVGLAAVPAGAQETKRLEPVIVTGTLAGDAGRADGRLGDGHRGRGVRHASLPDGRRCAAQRARRGDPALGLPREDDVHQHPRRQSQPGAGARGRRAGQEPHARLRRAGRHRARHDRAHRDHPGAAVHGLRRRRHRWCRAHHHQAGQRTPDRVGLAGGRQLRHPAQPGRRQRVLAVVRLRGRLLPPGVGRAVHQRCRRPERGERPLRRLPAGRHPGRGGGPLQQDRHRPADRVRRQSQPQRPQALRSQHPPGERDLHGQHRRAHAAAQLVGGRAARLPLREQPGLHRPPRSVPLSAGDVRASLRFPGPVQGEPQRGGGTEPLPHRHVVDLDVRHGVAGGERQRAGHQRLHAAHRDGGRPLRAEVPLLRSAVHVGGCAGRGQQPPSAARPPSGARSPT